VRLAVLTRHGQSTLNVDRRINGDPSVPASLSEQGRTEAELLGLQIAHLRIDLCVCSRFPRTHETAGIALAGRDVPLLEEPLLDDIDVGELDGRSIEDYERWKDEHRRSDPFPGGESLDDAARRYASAFERLAARPEETILVVCHEIPVRYAVNAAGGSDRLDGPAHLIRNASPYLFGADELRRAAARIRELV
jgi:broad specificity phosphatase PhoE